MSTAEMYRTAIPTTVIVGGSVGVREMQSEPSVGRPMSTHQRGPTHAELIEELIAWSTDPDGFDRKALENVNRDGWGIQR